MNDSKNEKPKETKGKKLMREFWANGLDEGQAAMDKAKERLCGISKSKKKGDE